LFNASAFGNDGRAAPKTLGKELEVAEAGQAEKLQSRGASLVPGGNRLLEPTAR
jgi:hypothetical protein